MRLGTAFKRAIVTQDQIDSLKAMRLTLESVKSRYEHIKKAVEEAERSLISKLESGAEIHCKDMLEIKIIERRYPSYKSILAEQLGTKFVEDVLKSTAPTIYKSLLIR